MDDQAVRNRIVRKLLRKRVVGGHKKQIDTVVNWLPSHAQGRARRLLLDMVTARDAPIEAYGGGSRENVRLSSVDDAVAYLERNGGDVPFGFE